MERFTVVEGIAAPLPATNIDTDVIMPKQFLKGVDRSGLGGAVFHDVRFNPAGTIDPTFILNDPAWTDTRFLVVGPNFGCGSSREHAVWGLAQFGIRALIGSTFAGIFYDNCARNGLLAISLRKSEVDELIQLVSDPLHNCLTINLERQEILWDDSTAFRFDIESSLKRLLLLGLDAVAETLIFKAEIEDFQAAYLADNPWLSSRPLLIER